LIQDGYIGREGRELIATAKGISLVTLLRGIGIELLSSPELTGEWEYQLKLMEQGQLERPAFMSKIKDLTRQIVDKAKNFESDVVEGNYVTLEARCPNCGGSQLKEDYRTYHCDTCGFRLFKNIASRELSPEEATILVRERKLGPLDGFRSKTGRLFSAQLVLNEENKAEFHFENNGLTTNLEVDPAIHPLVGPCQVCGTGSVYDLGSVYICENVSKGTCTFKMSKMILQREVSPDQLKKMLIDGKSDLLRRFISKKGRPFDAVLTLTHGKIGWEFTKRKSSRKKAAQKTNPGTTERSDSSGSE